VYMYPTRHLLTRDMFGPFEDMLIMNDQDYSNQPLNIVIAIPGVNLNFKRQHFYHINMYN